MKKGKLSMPWMNGWKKASSSWVGLCVSWIVIRRNYLDEPIYLQQHQFFQWTFVRITTYTIPRMLTQDEAAEARQSWMVGCDVLPYSSNQINIKWKGTISLSQLYADLTLSFIRFPNLIFIMNIHIQYVAYIHLSLQDISDVINLCLKGK